MSMISFTLTELYFIDILINIIPIAAMQKKIREEGIGTFLQRETEAWTVLSKSVDLNTWLVRNTTRYKIDAF